MKVLWTFKQKYSMSFNEGQTRFDMPRGAKMSLAPNEPKSSSFIFKHYLQACTSRKEILILYAKQPMGTHRGLTPYEKKHRIIALLCLKENSKFRDNNLRRNFLLLDK